MAGISTGAIPQIDIIEDLLTNKQVIYIQYIEERLSHIKSDNFLYHYNV